MVTNWGRGVDVERLDFISHTALLMGVRVKWAAFCFLYTISKQGCYAFAQKVLTNSSIPKDLG